MRKSTLRVSKSCNDFINGVLTESASSLQSCCFFADPHGSWKSLKPCAWTRFKLYLTTPPQISEIWSQIDLTQSLWHCPLTWPSLFIYNIYPHAQFCIPIGHTYFPANVSVSNWPRPLLLYFKQVRKIPKTQLERLKSWVDIIATLDWVGTHDIQ